MLPDDDKRYAIETCKKNKGAVKSVLKCDFKINDIKLVDLMLVLYLVFRLICFQQYSL